MVFSGALRGPPEGIEMNSRHSSETTSVSSPSLTPGNNRAAILLLGFQNEFVKKGGKLHGQVAETINSTGILQNVTKLVDYARQMGALIIYSPVVLAEIEKVNAEDVRSSGPFHTNEFFAENTWNCEIIHEVEPRNKDIVLADRNDFSAFVGTKLQSCLEEHGVEHFFVTGFLTDSCVYKTSMDAVTLLPEMETYVVSDGCGTKTMQAHNTALGSLAKKSVNIVSSSDAESIVSKCAVSKRKNTLHHHGNDEWQMIEKIFSAGGAGKTDDMCVNGLHSLIESLPSSSSILSTLIEKVGKRDREKRISRSDMHKILFQRKPRSGFIDKLPIFMVMIYMPFFYSISTRIPFIFVALEITVARGRELWQVGLVLGLYQFSRAIGNLLIVVLGGKNPFQRLQFPLILSALFGWFFLAFYDREGTFGSFVSSSKPHQDNSQGDTRALYALFWVGLCETIVMLQRALMTETANESPSGIIDERILAKRFSIQYSMVALGSVFAFAFGGWLYTEYGYFAVCDFGILIQIAHLFGAMLYLALAKKNKMNLKSSDELDGNDMVRSVIYQFQSLSVIAKYAHDIAHGAESPLDAEASGLSNAIVKAKSDRVLNHSLKELFQHSFRGKKRDDVSSMEDLLESTENSETGVSLKSRRPLVMAIGRTKLARLLLHMMKSKGREYSLTETEFVSFWAPRVYLSMFQSSHASSVSVTWPYMKAVILTQKIAALCIGMFLSTALLSYTRRFDIDAARVGLLLGIGEGLGAIVIFAKNFLGMSTKNSGSILGAISSRPLNMPFVLLLTGLSTMCFSIDSLMVAVFCQMVCSSVNDLSVSLMNELAGTSLPDEKFKYYQGTGQWLRRLGNMVTAILGPILFGVDEKLPFTFFGAIVFAWALFLWSLMYTHAKKMQESFAANSWEGEEEEEEDGKCCISNADLVEPFRPFLETSRTPWHELEKKYFVLNKEELEDELNDWKKTRIDLSMMEHRIRRMSAALEVEKDQRRALEDKLYDRVSSCLEPYDDQKEETESLV